MYTTWLWVLYYTQINVSFTFITEGAIIGFVSGLLGIILSLKKTVNKTKDEGGYVRGANYYGGKNND